MVPTWELYDQVKAIQPICFENACWAYTVGAAIAIKKDCRRAADARISLAEYFFYCVCVWGVFCLNKCKSIDT